MDKAGKEADKYKDDDGGSKAGKDVPKPDPDKVKAATRNANSAEKAQTAAKSDVSAAKSNLDAAKKMAEDARKMREDAAGTAKKKLEDASDAGIQNRKWWEEVGDWVTDNWDTIVAVCKVVVAVLGVIAMIIGGPILGAIVLIAALVVLADTLHKYANGEAGLLDVAFAALDCIPGMKGLTSLRGLAKGLKSLGKAGLKGMARGLRRGSGDALQRARRRPRNGPPMPMTMDSVRQISGRYQVDLVGIRVNINRRVSGLQGSTPSSGEIRLYRDAFYDEETLARTLAHERFHVGQIREGGQVPTNEAELRRWEDEAYAYEDEWWKNHPVNNRREEGEPSGE